MVGIHNERSQILDIVWAKVCKAAYSNQAIQTGYVARQLAECYPNCGMTAREIEDEIIRQVGWAGGAAELGDETTTARTGGRRPVAASSPGAYWSGTLTGSRRR